jgi:decaprenylphospho-beta-D-ribofuranose 2-oxidase
MAGIPHIPTRPSFATLFQGPASEAQADPVAATLHDASADVPEHGNHEELVCYSQMYTTHAEVLRPADVDELALIFADARAHGRRMTLRAGGNSFDAQSLGSDIVVSLEHLDAIGEVVDVDADECITVGAGATWGDILKKVEPLGLVPAIMVTTEKATAGGTLSGNCLSRFSPTLGKEGGWVKSFRLLTVGGERMLCTAPADDERPETWTLAQRVFMAAIGGLGYLGAVYEITYKLVRAYDPDAHGVAPLAMETTLTKHKTYEHLAQALVGEARRMCHTDIPEGMSLADHAGNQAIYSGLIRRWNAKQSAVVFTSTYTTDAKRVPLAIHQPMSPLRFVAEMLLRTRVDWLLTLFAYHALYRQGKTYIDDLRGFTFFMDGNSRCKAWGKRHGMKMPTVQQTFVVPFDPDEDFASAEEAEHAGCEKLAAWLDESHNLLRAHNVRPTFSDVLFIRDTKPFGLSATAGKAGFAVSYAFETSDDKRLKRVEQAFAALADKLTDARWNGRVYLVKNVYASQATLRAMYGDNAIGLLRLKRRLDPDRMLANDFFERNFGELAAEVYAGLHGEDTSE